MVLTFAHHRVLGKFFKHTGICKALRKLYQNLILKIKLMRILSPKQNSLKYFCYINLYVYHNHTEFLKGGTFIDKLKFIGLKKVVKQKMKQISNALYVEHCFEMNKLKNALTEKRENGWDALLNNVVLRFIIKNSTEEVERSFDLLFTDILTFFTLEVQNRYDESNDILKLKNEVMELETSMILLISEVCFKNSKGQYARLR